MTYTPEQFAKLPKWAQHEIERLEANINYITKQRDQMLGDAEPSIRNPVLAPWIGDKDTVLPAAPISYPAFGIRIYVDNDDKLVINGTYSLRIEPSASNVIHITGLAEYGKGMKGMKGVARP